MKLLLTRYRAEVIGVLIGMLTGWSYWYFAGCASGTCSITSKPLNSALYGAMTGFAVFRLFKKENKVSGK